MVYFKTHWYDTKIEDDGKDLVKCVHTNVLLFKHLYFNEQKTCEANKKQIN